MIRKQIQTDCIHNVKALMQLATFHGDVDPRGQKQASEAIVEDLVALQRGCGVVGDFNTWRRIKRKVCHQHQRET